ncbi:MAG: HEAT repeat domain-containing protein [Cyanobacteria bacterium CRU_2_1]|nr:HEAT repeat domain-containing protein [Cyanobacteria bacterium CRU_2_1]
MRWDAAKQIPNFGAEAIAPLLTILQDEEADWELLWFVARILGNLEGREAIDALITLLKTADNTEVAGMAATALANLGAIVIPSLSGLLTDESTRLLAVQTLSQIRHPDVVPPLLQRVEDDSPVIRAGAIESLSHFYDPAISAALVLALKDPSASVRQAAITGLGIQADRVDKLQLTYQLKPLLWDVNLAVCQQTAIALGRVGTNEAADALFEVLRSPHTPLLLQIEAVRALAWIGSVHGLNILESLLNAAQQRGNGMEVSHEIMTILGRVDHPIAKQRAVEILLNLLQSNCRLVEDIKSKQAIALSLGQLGQLDALNGLIELLADANASVRFHAIAALKQLDVNAAHQRLQELAMQDDLSENLKQGVAIALQEWKI